jgi:hypothetical protein
MAQLKTQKNEGSVEGFLEDVDLPTLKELVKQSVDHVAKTSQE